MKPNKAEVDALRDVLMTPLSEFITEKEEAEHKDPEGLAQKRMFERAIEAVDEARGERTLYMVVLRFGADNACFYHAYGPYSTQNMAHKALTGDLRGFPHSAYAVVPTTNIEGLRAHIEKLDAPPERRATTKAASDEMDKRMRACSAQTRTHIRDPKIKSLGNVRDLRAQVERGMS